MRPRKDNTERLCVSLRECVGFLSLTMDISFQNYNERDFILTFFFDVVDYNLCDYTQRFIYNWPYSQHRAKYL
jgi:hypothetical protein